MLRLRETQHLEGLWFASSKVPSLYVLVWSKRCLLSPLGPGSCPWRERTVCWGARGCRTPPLRAPQWYPLGLFWAPSTPPSMAVPRPLVPGAQPSLQLWRGRSVAAQAFWALVPVPALEGPPWTLYLLLSSLQPLSLENGPCGSRQKSLCAALSGPSGPSVFPLCCDPSRPGPRSVLG